MNFYSSVHKKKVHKDTIEISSHICETCGKSFDNSSNLKKHVKRMHEEQQSCPCDQCGKILKSQKYLKEHIMSVHEGIKTHKCHICDKAFPKPYLVKRHIEGSVTRWITKNDSYHGTPIRKRQSLIFVRFWICII